MTLAVVDQKKQRAAAPVASDTAEGFFGAKERLARMQTLLMEGNPKECGMFKDPPDWLSSLERRQVEALLNRVVDEYAPRNFYEMVWCVLTDAIRPRAKGRKPKWLGMDGVFLVADIERVLKAKGWKRDKKKGLANAIAVLQASDPQRYGKHSSARLHAAYYEALPLYEAVAVAAARVESEQRARKNEDAESDRQMQQFQRRLKQGLALCDRAAAFGLCAHCGQSVKSAE